MGVASRTRDGGGEAADFPVGRQSATRRAWLRFLVCGGALFALSGLLAPSRPPAGVSSGARGRAAPLSDQELLLRRALARGYQWSDPVVRRRLAMNLRFALGVRDASQDQLVTRALAMGMEETDLVVRRRLAERISLEIQAAARAKEPSEAELRAWIRAHPQRFTAPARIHLQQIPLPSAARARVLLRRLGAGQAAISAAAMALPVPRDLPDRSQAELARLLGGRFAERAFALPVGKWAGPLRSPYAFHLVRVVSRTGPHPIPFARVRSAARESLLEERAQRALREQLSRWRREAAGVSP